MSLEEEQARQRAAEGDSSSAARANSSRPEGIEGQTTAVPADGSNFPTSIPATDAAAPTSVSEAQPGGSLIPSETRAVADVIHDDASESEDSMLKQALALSQSRSTDEDVQMSGVEQPQYGAIAQDPSDATGRVQGAPSSADADDEEMTEEEAIARAIEMSLQDEGNGQ